MADKYEWTEQQEEAIGQLVADKWGCDTQSGWDFDGGVPYIYFKRSPNEPAQRYSIHPDGTVMRVQE